MSAQENIERFKQQIEAVRNQPGADAECYLPAFPLKMDVTFHDCAGANFWDANGNAVLVDLIPYPELAVQIEWLLNQLAKRAGLIP